MTAIERNSRFILSAVLAEIELFAEMPDDAIDAGEPFAVTMCREGVPFTPAVWSGSRLPSARRVAFSRAAHRLAQRGEVVRVTERLRDRVRCLVLTPTGLARALALVGKKADRSALREGLQRTKWGRALARRLKGGSV